MKNILKTTMIGATLLSSVMFISCQQAAPILYMTSLDSIAKDNASIGIYTAYIEQSIRESDNPEAKVEAYLKAATMIDDIIAGGFETRDQLEQNIRESLSNVFSDVIVNEIVAKVLVAFDNAESDLQMDEDTKYALEKVLSEITGAIALYTNPSARPAILLPALPVSTLTK